jgi:hypothetical protein
MERQNKTSPQQEESKKGIERRIHPRLHPSAIPDLRSIRLQGGGEANIINISKKGALLETQERVTPGAGISIRLVAADAVFLMRGRILRSRAKTLRESVPVYEAAIEFETELTVLGDADQEIQAAQEPASNETQEDMQDESTATSAFDEHPAPAVSAQKDYYEFTAFIPPSGVDLRQIFGLNDW